MTLCDFCGTSLEKEVRENRVNTLETRRFMPALPEARTHKPVLCNACMNEMEKAVAGKMRNLTYNLALKMKELK